MNEPVSDSAAIAADIASQLQETNPVALAQIGRFIQQVGVEAAQALLAETRQVEAQGGLLVRDGSRRRTPGGVYLYLAKGRLSEHQRREVFLPVPRPARDHASMPPTPPLTWADLLASARESMSHAGEATIVKITLIGRPERVIDRDQVVIATLRGGKAPTLPKGVPAPPAEPTLFICLIGRKQWDKVTQAVQAPQDALVVEGYPVLDKQLRGIVVYVTSVTTRKKQAARRPARATEVG